MIKIITDNGADIPLATAKKHDIDILKIALIKDEADYYIGENINRETMFDDIRNGAIYGTSQVTRMDIYTCFENYVKAGREVIYITLSSGLSGTYSNAVIARQDLLEEYPDAKVYVIDSKSATFGQGMLVIKASMMAKAGLDAETIVKKTEKNVENQIHLFTVGDLDFLHRGGRLSKTSAVIGELLNILPVLHVDRENGKLAKIDIARGQKAFIKKLNKLVDSQSKDGKFNPNQTVALAPGHWDEMTELVKKFFIEERNVKEENLVIVDLDCVIAAHTGPEAMTIFFSADPDDFPYLEM